jgi:site-specific recombinase XerD
MDSNMSTALVPIDRCDCEEVALAGFLAGYRGSTREAYALDLRQFAGWCANRERRLFDVHRLDIESFGRDLEARGRRERPSLAGCARSRASTATPRRKP